MLETRGKTAVGGSDVEPDAPGGSASESTDAEAEAAVESGGDDSIDLSLDVAFELLKNERRRRVLEHLEAAEGPVRLGDLAEHIAAQENDTTVDALTSSERKRVYVGLYQCHLPKMDDADVVDFNRDRGIVELSDNAAELRPYLDREPRSDRPWHAYYAAIGSGSVPLYAGGLLGLLPFAHVMGVVLALFLTCAIGHSYQDRAAA